MSTFRTRIDITTWYQKLLEPRSQTADQQRRELILNILLCGLTVIAVIAVISNIINRLQGVGEGSGLPMLLIFTTVVAGLWRLSRRGHFQIGANVLTAFLMLAALILVLTYSFELPSAQLMLALAIVIAGVLLTARAALIVSCIIAIGLLPISYAQISGYLHPDVSWSGIELEMASAVGYTIQLLAIGLVAWLANRETGRSLARARASEADLEHERDTLEVKVAERTRELEEAQLIRVMELQRLAEFGRLSAGLLHEVANPLTVASLNLEQLSTEPRPVLLRRAVQSLQHIERFVEAARMQLKGQGVLTRFQLQQEIKQVMSILAHRARQSGVKVELLNPNKARLFGDPVKFNQLMANLIVNAIEAYDGNASPTTAQRRVTIEVVPHDKYTTIRVKDWGRGMNKEEMEQIFEPFYTNKPSSQRNMGIGLAMVQRIVKDDFRGRVHVTSSAEQGTCFSVMLKDQTKPGI